VGRWKQAVTLSADSVHDCLREAALQQFDQGIDASCAVPTDGFPTTRFDGRDADLDLVELRAGEQRVDFALGDLKMDDRAVPNIGAAGRQSIRIVAVAFQIIAPGLAPEALGDDAAVDRHWRNRLPILPELLQFLLCLPPPLRDRNVRPELVPAHR